MGKVTKRRGKSKYNYDINRKRLWKKSKRLPKVQCKEMKANWDNRKSVQANMADMGLSADPNKTLRIKTTKESLVPEEVDVAVLKKMKKTKTPVKEHVMKALEEEASIPPPPPDNLYLKPEVHFLTHMLDTYGDDYKAMARDPKNIYQDTPKQIKKKLMTFKNTPALYGEYLKSKVDAACGACASVCLSPVASEPRTSHVVSGGSLGSRERRITRKYEAARRNGHFTLSPEVVDDSDVTLERPSMCLSRVRRKLQFGRKPPRNRDGSPQP